MRSVEEIYQELAADFQTRTGLSAGSSELAVRFYAVAAQLCGLHAQAEWTCRQCFPQTAEGEYLDRHAQLRGVSRHLAAAASGVVRFYAGEGRQQDTAIPAGTVCMTAGGLRYLTTGDAAVAAGEAYADVPVEAAETGADGNVAAGTIVYMAVPPTGITVCTNPDALSNGRDEEDDDSLRERVLATYQRLANGANSAFYQQAAMSFDGVAAAVVQPRSRGVGTVDVIIAAQDGIPDEELLAQVQDYFDGVREIAVDVQVLPPTAQTVKVTAKLKAADGYETSDVARRAQEAVKGWFTGERLGQPVLRAELTALLFGLEGVANCTVTEPAADVTADGTVLPVMGVLSISVS